MDPASVADALAEVADEAGANLSLGVLIKLQGLVAVGKVAGERLLQARIRVGAVQSAVAVADGDVDVLGDVLAHGVADEAVAELVDLDEVAQRGPGRRGLGVLGGQRRRVCHDGRVAVGQADVEGEGARVDVVVELDPVSVGLAELAVQTTRKVL